MRIGPPNGRAERNAAVGLLLGEPAGAVSERVRETEALADAGEIDLGGLIAAWDGGELVGVSLFITAGDGSAIVWPVQVRDDRHDRRAIAPPVLEAILRSAESAGCPFAQALVEADVTVQRDEFEAAGFDYLTDLLYLQRPLDDPSPSVEGLGGVSFCDETEQRFARVIGATYVGSRDCPAFAGWRTPADALRSYRGAGMFTPARWRIVEQDDEDVGVVLVNDHPQERAREIVYLGLVPAARGCGLGARIVANVIGEAQRDGCAALFCAVDVTNTPAVSLYARLGFFPVGRRAVYLRLLGASDERRDAAGG